MASGWGCQYLTIKDGKADWCRKLNHKCEPGCKGCIIAKYEFTQPELLSLEKEEPRKIKKRDDNSLANR